MLYPDNAIDWTRWLANHTDADEATKLAALRRFIVATATNHLGSYVTAEWANKKLRSLGITERIRLASNGYVLTAPTVGTVTMSVTAADRAGAVQEFTRLVGSGVYLSDVTVTAGPVFISGPEDASPADVHPDAPTTVDATLAKLREVILLGVVAGPRYCVESANEVLDEYDLGSVPARQQFVVTRPATATLRTVVEAYDEASAEKVAAWRWDDGRSGYTVAEADPTDGFAVDVN